MLVEGELLGVKELSRQLEKLEGNLTGKVLRQAVGAALTPVVREAKQTAPKGDRARRLKNGRFVAPGFLSRSIKKRTWKSRSGLYASAKVGVSGEAFYGVQFVERGYTVTDKNKKKHGKKAPNEWLGPAFEKNKQKIENEFKKQLLKRIKKYTK